MPKSRHRKKSKRAKRPSYDIAKAETQPSERVLQSDLGKEMWSMVSGDVVLSGCVYDEAFALAKRYLDEGFSAVVMTDRAANRMTGSNELI